MAKYSEISIPVAYTNKKLFNKNGETLRFHVEINIVDVVSARTYDFSVVNALNGEAKCSLAASNVVVFLLSALSESWISPASNKGLPASSIL